MLDTGLDFQGMRTVNIQHSDAVHALQEYRLWRDNDFIGKELGAARPGYVRILRQRVHEAIDSYRATREQGPAAGYEARGSRLAG